MLWRLFVGSDLDRKLRQLDVVQRRIEASIVAATDHAERSGHYLADGHRTVSSWLMATTNCSRSETRQFADFRVVTERWERLADADGAHHDHERTHQLRNARCTSVGVEYRFETSHGVIFKHSHGYAVERRADGTIEITRPDGTRLKPPDAA